MSVHLRRFQDFSQEIRTKRSTPSPTKLSLQSFSRQSTLKNPEYSLIYPSWLIERNDFQEIFEQYENFDRLDLSQVFRKPLNERKDPEWQAIYKFIHSCYFFSNIFNSKVLIRNFELQTFEEGDDLSTGERFVRIILKGKVQIDEELVVDKFNALGEFAIFENKEQKLTALTKVSLIAVNQEDYKTLFLHPRLKQLKQLFPVLEKIPYFSEIKSIRLEKIASCSIPYQIEKNEEIFKLGDPASYFFVLLSGRVILSSRVKLQSSNDLPIGMNKKEKLVIEENFYSKLTTIKEHQAFGLWEAVKREKRSTVATTSEESIVAAIRFEEFLEIITIQEKEGFYEKITEIFNNKSLGNMIRSKIKHHKKHISALMQASEIKPGHKGRETFEIPKRKRAYARVLYEKQDTYLKENLVSKSYSFRDVILPKIRRVNQCN
jgi:CRP-like cAMP-binding protein